MTAQELPPGWTVINRYQYEETDERGEHRLLVFGSGDRWSYNYDLLTALNFDLLAEGNCSTPFEAMREAKKKLDEYKVQTWRPIKRRSLRK